VGSHNIDYEYLFWDVMPCNLVTMIAQEPDACVFRTKNSSIHIVSCRSIIIELLQDKWTGGGIWTRTHV